MARSPDAADAGSRRNPKGRGIFQRMPALLRLSAWDSLCDFALAPWPPLKSAPSRPRVILLEAPTRLLIATLLVGLLFLQTGCSYPRALQTHEYLTDYDRMTDRFDPFVSLAYMPEGAKFEGFKSFIIGKAEVGHSWVEDRAAAESYAIYFRRSLHQRLSQTTLFESVSLDSDPAVLQGLPQPALLVEAKITKFDFGAGWKRYFGWFVMMEAGASDFQIEGRVTELATGKLVLEFVDRRRYLGNTAFGPAPRTFNDDFVMKSTVREAAGCLAEFIQDAYGGLPPESDKGKRRGSKPTD